MRKSLPSITHYWVFKPSLPNSIITGGDIGTADNRGFACAWGDYDNDGFVDLVVALPAGFAGLPLKSNHLLKNNGDGSFTKIDSGATVINSGQAPYTVPSWSDYDQDGDLDLFIGSGPANGTIGPDYLYRNLLSENGAEPFERISSGQIALTPRDGQVFNWIDYDNDGDIDLFVPNLGRKSGNARIKNFLFRNELSAENNWINISCAGTQSNRAAIGTRVRAKAMINGQTVWQMREISAQNSFNGHNSFRVHFGLGDAVVIEQLVFEWPSGAVDVLHDVAVNQFIQVTESTPLSKGAGEADPTGAALPERFELAQNYPNPYYVSSKAFFEPIAPTKGLCRVGGQRGESAIRAPGSGRLLPAFG